MRFWLLIVALFVSLAACKDKGGDDTDKDKAKAEDDDDSSDKKKKKKKGSAASASATGSEAAKPASSAPAPAPAPAPAGGMPDFPALLGAKSDGWYPKVFASLKEDMTAAEAGAVFKGAEKVDEYGFSAVPAVNVPGVASYHFSFLEGKLKFASIWFTQELFTPDFKTKLVDAAKARWGDPEPGKPEDSSVMWINPDFKMVSVSEIIDLDAKGYEIKIAL